LEAVNKFRYVALTNNLVSKKNFISSNSTNHPQNPNERKNYLISELDKKTFLITGGRGNLSSAFVKALKKYAPNSQIICPSKIELDIEKPESFNSFRSFKPDFVLHCAAKVNADFCESHPDKARRNIVEGTENSYNFSSKIGAHFFYPQSFLIFDGDENPTTEETSPAPLSVYGRYKLEAEKLLLLSDQTLVVRMGGFFGGESKDKNFVGKMHSHINFSLQTGRDRIEVGERIWQPTYTKDLAENILVLLSLKKFGIYHMASLGHASFLEVASTMVDVLGLSQKIAVVPFANDLGWKNDVASRPNSVLMNNSRLILEDLNFQRNWKQALTEYLSLPFFNNSDITIKT
jgi:dTDP-4-dehydrorhamnose reductase